MADQPKRIDYQTAVAALERGSAPYFSIGPIPSDGSVPLILYISFNVDDDEDFEHHDDIANAVATIHAMNTGIYDELFPESAAFEERRRADR
jgi:hypothetical protein